MLLCLTLHCHPDSDERQQGQGRDGSREKLSMKRCHSKCDIQRGQVYTTWWCDTWYLSRPYQTLWGAAAAPLEPAWPQLSCVKIKKKGGKKWNYAFHQLSAWCCFQVGYVGCWAMYHQRAVGLGSIPYQLETHEEFFSVTLPCDRLFYPTCFMSSQGRNKI